MNQQRQAESGFDRVDQAGTPQGYVECLDAQRTTNFTRQYKRRTIELLTLQPGQQILDIGCGTGEEVRTMAGLVALGGLVTGLDYSQVMIDEARRRNQGSQLPIRFVQGSVYELPFADNGFDRCRADRVFMHLEEPEKALAEMLRVTRPGGYILIVEPDHLTRVIDTPYPEVTSRFLAFRNAGMKQPDIAHRLYSMYKDAGLVNVTVEAITQVTTDYETIRPFTRLAEGMRTAQKHGRVTMEEADKWITYIEEANSAGRFFHALTSFITLGQKPV
jgi:ubiquinone/menaquinone biosynthesis C-methylase UbiE